MRPLLKTLVGLALSCTIQDAGALAAGRLDFDGVDDRVMVPYDASFPTEVFTVSAWIKCVRPNRRAAIIARGEDDDSWDLSWHLYVHPNGTLEIMVETDRMANHCYPRTCMGQEQENCESGDLFVADDAWHHVAASRDAAGTMRLYVDGEEQAACVDTAVPR